MKKMTTLCLACIMAIFLTGCPSSNTRSVVSASADDRHYRLSTEYQGPTHPLSIDALDNRVSSIMLAESTESDDTQLWTLLPQGDGFYRIQNVSTGNRVSLAVLDDNIATPIRMVDTDDQSAQLWQIISLDNGYCRITSQLLGQGASIDIVNSDSPRLINMATSGNFRGQFWQLATNSAIPVDNPLSRCISTAQPTSSIEFIPTSAYRTATSRGFQLLISPEIDALEELTKATLLEIDTQLEAMERALPPTVFNELQNVSIWVELSQRDNAAAEYFNAEYNTPQVTQQNGINPEKVTNVEISNAEIFLNSSRTDQPMVLLHEFAHAWHFTHPEFFDDIRSTYEVAKASRIYESVEHSNGIFRQAYSLTNTYEYFAELSEAYFGKNEFYPFTRDELQQFDIEGYALVERVWGLPSTER